MHINMDAVEIETFASTDKITGKKLLNQRIRVAQELKEALARDIDKVLDEVISQQAKERVKDPNSQFEGITIVNKPRNDATMSVEV